MKRFKYLEIIDSIKKDIFPDLKPGSLLPDKSDLCSRYGVSDITVRKSLSLLSKAGLVKRIPGKGTVYSQSNPPSVSITSTSKSTRLRILTLNGWATGEMLEELCRNYSQTHPKIEFEFHRVSGDYYEDYAISDYDLVLVNTWMLRNYLTNPEHNRHLLPLSRLSGLYIDEEIYFPEALQWSRQDGELYCLPLGVSPVVAIFNMNYPEFSRHPLHTCRRADEFFAMLHDLKHETEGEASYFPFLMEFSENRWPCLVKMMGGQIIDPVTGEYCISHPQTISSLKQVKKMVDDKIAPGVHFSLEGPSPDLFSTGNIGCMWGTYKHVRACCNQRRNVSLQQLPEAQTRCSHLLIEGLVVNAAGRKLEKLPDFLNYLQTSASQLAVCRSADTFSAQKELAQLYLKSHFSGMPGILNLYHGVSHAEPVVSSPRPGEWMTMTRILLQYWLGVDSIDNVCRKIQSQGKMKAAVQ